MKRLTLLAALTASLAAAQPIPADLGARYEELRQATLKGDVAAVRSFYLPGARLIDVAGQPLSLEAALQGLNPSQVRFNALTYDLRDVRLAGDRATVQARQRAAVEVTPIPGTSQTVETDALSEDLWQKVGGQWRVAASRVLESETRVGGQVIRQQAPQALSGEQIQVRRAALSRVAVPLRSVRADARDGDLAWLGDLVRGARVLGAGEGSHGTAEHFQLKDRVFRELVTRHDFTVLAIEDSFSSGEAVDRYVRGEGPDDAGAATRQLQIAVWQTQEVRDLLAWMRQYNRTRGERPELRVVGIDMQDPFGSVRTLARLAPEDARLRAALAPLQAVTRSQWLALAQDPARQASLAAQVSALRTAVGALPATTPNRAQLVHLAETVRQGLIFWQGIADFGRANLIRDAAMSANVRSAFDTLFPGQRGMLWAHNFHVARVPAQGQTYTTLGQHLARAWGPGYRTLGFSFAGGELRALSADPAREGEGFTVLRAAPAPENSLDRLIATGAPAMYLSTGRALQDPVLRSWLGQPVALAAVGAVYAEGATTHAQVDLPAAFDGVIFVKESHPTRLLGER